jgi:sulfite exporter TauE/SafE
MDYWLAFLAGLFGSMHCVGMCGPIVLGYSTQGNSGDSSLLTHLTAHLAYNSGRVLSYTIVGAFLGFLGGSVTALHEIGYWFSLLLGILLVLAGVSLLRLLPRFSAAAQVNFEQRTRNILFLIYRKTFGALIGQKNLESKFYIGLMTPLLPCGLLYAMFLKAIAAGSFLSGAVTMFLFGVGIVPALVVTGLASSYFGQKLRVWGDKIAAVTILLMGLSLIWRALKVEALFHFH